MPCRKITGLFCKITVLILIVCILFTSCSFVNTSRLKINSNADTVVSNSFHRVKDFSVVCENGNYRMLFDKNTMTVGIKNIKSNFIWNTLDSVENNYSSVIKVDLIKDNIFYSLNSQDNSVAFSSAEYKIGESFVSVVYEMRENKNSQVICKCKVDYTFDHSTLNVTAEFEKVSNEIILSCELLPYFGSQAVPSKNDYFVLPDGSGSVMLTQAEDTKTDVISLDMYGGDCSLKGERNSKSIFPFFCEKYGNEGFACVITHGDAVCSVNAQRVNSSNPARVYSQFTLTPYSVDNDIITVAEKGINKVGAVYKFHYGDSADYSDFAQSVREILISEGKLNSKRVENSVLPFNLSVMGYVKNGKNDARITDFEDIQALLGLLKGKSINSINLFCKGYLSGGINQKSIFTANVNRKTGGKNGLELLYDYTSSNNVKLFLDVELISAGGVGFSLPFNAKTINNKKVTFSRRNMTFLSEGKEFFTRELLSSSKIKYSGAKAEEKIAGLSVDGIRITDCGDILFSDFSHSYSNMQTTQKNIYQTLEYLRGNTDIAVDVGNLYTLNKARNVTNIPMNCYHSGNGYEPIPFVQTVLHGYVNYSGEALNTLSDIKTGMLKAIEYGAVPYFEWVFDEDSIFYYTHTFGDAVEFYTKASDLLRGLSSSMIIKHDKLSDGFFSVTYENGTVIYVNYNENNAVTPTGITVAPMDAVRVGN